MIRFALTCDKDHPFDSWFASADAFDSLQRAGQLACPVCGSAKVDKSLMAPSVRPARKAAAQDAAPVPAASAPLRSPQNDMETAFAAMRKQIEDNSDYVGVNFVTEARKMHEGSVPERAIYGEAKLEDARALIEDGVPIAPLPFMPARKVN